MVWPSGFALTNSRYERLEFGWPWWAAGWSSRGQISSAGHSSSSLTRPWYVRFAPRPICLKPLLGWFLAICNSYRFAPVLEIWLTWLPCLSELDVTHLEALCSPPVELCCAGNWLAAEDIFDDLLALKLNGEHAWCGKGDAMVAGYILSAAEDVIAGIKAAAHESCNEPFQWQRQLQERFGYIPAMSDLGEAMGISSITRKEPCSNCQA
ncbi:hypothetical protein Nepgr_014747 [Nepenthes gracilis]|uniref:Uncharacterized protein n=1 Tax=Nepenthes gracilis TaxID=150966 RepID=A0AAD3SLS2_NEPGR|nr:hypothetical protein Nepgr_014747 [Nepenthes gracilis]